MKKLILLSLLLFFVYEDLLPQDSTFQKILSMSQQVDSSNLVKHIKQLEFAGGHHSRVNLTPGNDSASAYIYRELKKLPGLEVTLDTFFISSAIYPYNIKPMVNVIATKKGSSVNDKYFILGAHLDCSASRMGTSVWESQWKTIKAPGADDNATGVASILEIARIISDPEINFQHEYSIRLIAFGAEESGPAYNGSHHGSLHYAENAKARSESIIGMSSIDMIGYNNLYEFNSIVSNGSSDWLGNKFIEAAEIFEIPVQLSPPPFATGTYSDHDSFWDYGYSAVLFIEYAPPWNNGKYYKANPYYHTSSDTFGTVNVSLVKKVTQVNFVTAASFVTRLQVTDLDNEENIPSNHLVLQNYPNPFNPATTISFNLPEQSNVSIKMYNLQGEEVLSILNEQRTAGRHEINLNAAGFVSGLYFLRLVTESDVNSLKILLLK